MTPKEFLQHYRYDERLVTGGYYSTDPLVIQPGDTVGVVLLNMGGPHGPDEVESFLYNLFMDPAIIDIPVPKALRHPLCKKIAEKRSQTVREEYALIGGASPINPHTERQARLLEARLNDERARKEGVAYRVYTAMRYGTPSSEDVAAAMQRDGITSVVLLPLYPHYSKTTTGASLSYWHALSVSGELHKRPTTYVKEYAAHPYYIRAISERIDEGLARFKGPTDDVFLLFSAHGTPVKEMKKRGDPYCCLVHSTVHRVMVEREFDRDFQVAFQSKVGPVEWLTPSTPDALEALSESGRKRVLVIPVAFVSDHVETVFELDIEVRHQAMDAGIEAFEVTEGLNDHPAFIDTLVDVTLAQIRTGVDVAHEGLPGAADEERPERRFACFEPGDRPTACNQCLRIAEARRWDVEPQPEVSMI